MPMSSEFNYDTGEKRIVKNIKIAFCKLHFYEHIYWSFNGHLSNCG